MDASRTITFRWITDGPDAAGYHLSRLRFTGAVPTWQPAINVYRCDDCIRVCVDLAGVERSEIDLTVHARRLSIRGSRSVPESRGGKASTARQILAMEIDYGPFERTLEFRQEIDVPNVRAEQENGLLWIHLPLKS